VTPVFALKELVSRLRREQDKIQDLLSSLGFALRSFNNLNQFLELIPMMASRVTDCDGGALILFKPDGQMRLERVHCQGSDRCQDVRRAIETATRQVAKTFAPQSEAGTMTVSQGAMLALDRQISHFFGSDIQFFGTAIIVKNIERGRLYVFSRDPNYTWTETRQKLVRLVADQTAVAIENDELTVQLRKKDRLDRELEIGAEIQLQLLPRHCPNIEGVELAASCKTANRVGGDYYDFIPANYDEMRLHVEDYTHPDRSPWSFAIGDVMGKGVPAGLIMTMLRGMLRAEVLNRHSPARILQHLNRVMYADLENSNRFVTLFYSEYDPENRVLRYSNAAHNPPLLWRASTQSIKRLDTLGMLIGLERDTQYQDAQVHLHPGDTLIYYTDGFTDAANQHGDRFDEDNLINSFRWACENFDSPQEILDYLFGVLQQFIGPARHNEDDMTLIVMRVRPDGWLAPARVSKDMATTSSSSAKSERDRTPSPPEPSHSPQLPHFLK
jgi:sigma-B regulation protein RsbU (phosphoserine phosphatase)